MIDICLLGTAALMPLPERALTAAVLTCGGRSILFDCGEGTQTAARKQGVSLMKTDIIALTHYHGDHIFGLPGLLQTLFCMGRTAPLYITGPKGLERELAPILKLAGGLSYEVRLFEMPEEPVKLSKLVRGFPEESFLSAFPTKHRVESQGYCFRLERAGKFLPDKAKELLIPVQLWSKLQKGESVEANGCVIAPKEVMGERRKGLKFVFTGDTSPCEAIVRAAEKADLLICDSTYAEKEQAELALERGHMNFDMASRCAAEANVKRLWLAHYSQLVTEPEEALDMAAGNFPGAECGIDGKRITLKFDERESQCGMRNSECEIEVKS